MLFLAIVSVCECAEKKTFFFVVNNVPMNMRREREFRENDILYWTSVSLYGYIVSIVWDYSWFSLKSLLMVWTTMTRIVWSRQIDWPFTGMLWIILRQCVTYHEYRYFCRFPSNCKRDQINIKLTFLPSIHYTDCRFSQSHILSLLANFFEHERKY